MNGAQVEEAIEAVFEQLGVAETELRACGDAAAESETDYKIVFAQQRLLAKTARDKVTDKDAEDAATLATTKEQLAYRLAANRFVVQREVMKAIESRLEGLRTLSASQRRLP